MKKMVGARRVGYGLTFLLALGVGAAEAEDMSKWIDESEGFKATRVCEAFDFEIVAPPFSTENEIADGDTCGKIYIFVDSDSNKRVGFAGAMVFDRIIDPGKYAEARRQLITFIAKAGGEEGLRIELSEKSARQASGFSFETIGMTSNGIQTPDGKMTWEVGLRPFGNQTVMIFNGLTDLAWNQEILNGAERKSASDLLEEFDRWKSESLARLTAAKP